MSPMVGLVFAEMSSSMTAIVRTLSLLILSFPVDPRSEQLSAVETLDPVVPTLHYTIRDA
jgi:hypothetical protein